MVDKFHCEECAGLAKSREEECFTCDGEGKLKVAKVVKLIKLVKKTNKIKIMKGGIK